MSRVASSKGRTTVASTPRRSRRRRRCASERSGFGAAPSRIARGCVSKVRTTASPRSSSAKAFRRSRTWRWPRWTPSKTPIATTGRRKEEGESAARPSSLLTRLRARAGGVGAPEVLELLAVLHLVGGRHAVDEHHPVQVVELVLEDARDEAVEV